MKRAGVIGATGYAGAELVKILSAHPQVDLTVATSRQYAGKPFTSAFPFMRGLTDLVCEELDMDTIADKTDVVFTSLPHKLPLSIVPQLIERGVKVIDLSADFRFSNVETYEAFYQPHTAKDLLGKAVYGLSEVYADEISKSDLIGNPGCYPTTVLLPLVPLVRKGMIETDSIIADSKSGVSGAGRSVSLGTHFCEVNEGFKAYKLDGHRHRPEMEEILSKESGRKVDLTFVPHLVPLTRGMLTTLYTKVKEGFNADDLMECLVTYYKGKRFVRIYPDVTQPPDVRYVQNTNFCDIGFHYHPETRQLVIVSAINNLVKGASGQAVQNMNIMLGFDETTGLI
jgi:N-acetyl-gamma-glutamyl-phosphate reductase